MKPLQRLSEPSTWAGLAAMFHAVPALIASKGTDMGAWGIFAAAFAAIATPEATAKAQ